MTASAGKPAPFLWTAEHYQRMSDGDVFHLDEKLELFAGEFLAELRVEGPQFWLIIRTREAVRKALGTGYIATTRMALHLLDDFVPNPSVAVVNGDWDDYIGNVPRTACLVAHIPPRMTEFDRGERASLFAKAKIEDLRLLDVHARTLELCREPVADKSQPFGWNYAERRALLPSEFVSPLAAPNSRIAVADLLCREKP